MTDGAGFSSRHGGPVAAARRAIDADRAHADPAIWIFRLPDADILARARILETEGPRGRPLWGVPFAVKDNIDVAGMPTTAGCPAFAHVPESNAPVVDKLLDAGAILVGKTNLDQFATGLVGVRSPYGIPRNVFDAARVPGGSSSGSACAVAAGIVPFSLGTDTAGSGRVPAMFGNVVGYKPTIGSFSTSGVVPACRSIDTVSVFAGTVDEALAVARVAAGYDDADRYSRRPPFPYLRRSAMPSAARIAVAGSMPYCADEIVYAYRAAGEFVGAEPIDITPLLDIAQLLYDGPWVAERTAGLREILARHPHEFLPVTRQILEGGFARRTVDAFDAFHQLAAARRVTERFFESYDALIVPTAPFCPTLAEIESDPIGPNSRLGTFTNFVNLCDLAAYAIPAGFGDNGLPVGVTVLGPAWSEGRLAALADALHRRYSDRVGATTMKLKSPAPVDGAAPDETALFCVGAHMSALPLNHQLRTLGGRYLRDAATVPEYRLYAMGARPGMVRDAGAPEAAAIAGEVWALPTSAIGALLSQVPAPLGFGTVALADGPCLGFLTETAGIAGAREITQFGGWRGWLSAGRPAL